MKFLSSILLAAAPALAVWPVPEKITTGESVLWIAKDVQVTYNGAQLAQVQTRNYPTQGDDQGFDSHKIIAAAVSRTIEDVVEKNFVPWMLYERNGLEAAEPKASDDKAYIKKIEIVQSAKDTPKTWKGRAGEVDESYTLSVKENGDVKITSATAVGVLHALQSFSQLFYKHSDGGSAVYTNKAPVEISDKPQYDHRGLMIDVARSWLPLDAIYRTIEALAWNKLNRVHIHITDSQSWPLEVPSMPELHQKGAYSKGMTYSPEDLKAIQIFGLERGVQVIFEIDTPGHFGIAALSHPDLIAAWQATPYQDYCAEPPCGQLKLNHPGVDEFLDKLMDDVLPRTSPYSSYHHIGGDEVNFNAIALDETVGTNDSKVLQPLLQKFLTKHTARVKKHGLTTLVWEEFPLEYNTTLDEDTVVQSWLGDDYVKKLVQQGRKTINSNYNYYYLDCGRGHWLNFPDGDSFQTNFPFNDWCSPAKGWRLIYSYDPRGNMTKEEAKFVIGGEVAAWSETIDHINLDTVLWPRTSALGEVLWSGRTDAAGQNRTQMDAAPRLAEFRERMVARGISSAPVYMPFCTQGMNATACEYIM